MNKQDILNQIEWHLEETEGENASGTFDQGYKEGCYHCEALIEQLDEPQKVKVPAFVAEKMKRYKSALWMLSSEYFDTSSEVDSDELANWIDQNSEKFFRAWLDGYEVEEEPKYRVNIGGLYLKEPLADTNDFTISMTWNKDYAYPFDSWNMAREHTSELGGTVEKV